MHFAHPSLLWCIAALVPMLALFFLWSWRTRRRLIREFVPQRLQASLTVGLSPRRALARAASLTLAISLLLVALARPRYGAGTVEVKQRGLDIVIGIDTSRSMLAEDAGPGISRLDRARLAALDLARLARRDRLGLVAFAGTAFLQCPLTVDDAAFRQSLEALDTDIIPQGGTALGAAIRTALGAFGDDRDNVRVLVLLTDGEDHEASAEEAAKDAAARGLKVFTVGVGTARGELIRLTGPDGSESYLKDSEGNVVKSSLNEGLLRAIAEAAGGFYLPLQGPRAMEELFTRGLEPLPRSDLGSRSIVQFHERFQWPLALALGLLVWEAILPDRRKRPDRTRVAAIEHPTLGGASGPSASRPARPAGGAPVAVVLAVGVAAALASGPLAPTATASSASALRHYKEGDYESALREYERLSVARPGDPRYRFNAGAAAYRAGDFTNATRHFEAATRAHDLALQRDGYYNLGNALFKQGENAADHQQRRAAWEGALRSYQNALNLAPDETRARDNLEYVRRQLENLKNQPQQDSSSSGSQDQKDNQDQKPDASQKPDNSKNEQKEKSDPSKESSQDSPPNDRTPRDDPQDSPDNPPEDSQEKSKDQDGSQEKKPKEDASAGKSSDTGKDKPQPSPSEAPSPADEGSSKPVDAGDQAPAGQMTPNQALRLLDTTRGEEKMMPLDKRRARARVLKNW